MFSGLSFGQYLPLGSVVHRLDPRTKLVLVLAGMSAVFLARGWVSLVVAGAAVMGLALASRVGMRSYLRGIRSLWLLVALTALLQMFLVPGTRLWSLGALAVTREGVAMAAFMVARLVLVFVLAQLLTFTTSPVALVDGSERLLAPLRRLGLPAHEMAMVMTIALRFIPVLFEEADKIVKAQVSRGASFQAGGVRSRLQALSSILVPLFVRAFQRSDELALAMEVRCYQGGEGRTRMNRLCLQADDYVFLAAAAAVLVVVGVLTRT
ncbi:MAG: energy-coupling factor transporter transmembrane component T [Syntrophomonadaceae bacterium]|nr:energy-coupling factor transporter transmembrane component T [Syntrophomonadaceae bacterium]